MQAVRVKMERKYSVSIAQSFADLPIPEFTDPRKTSLEVHAHLRRLIIDSALPPGSVLKQTELARLFNISRTPMREAFRMLQEEGLIEADLNQRARVRQLDVDELDQLYGTRIALESLGARITTGRIEADELEAAHQCIEDMELARANNDSREWAHIHRKLHGLCVARAGEPMLRVINSYSERSERYLRLYQLWHPQSFIAAQREHEEILDSVQNGEPAKTGKLMARHLAHTALTVLRDVSPDASGHVIQQALAMVTGAKGRQTS